MFNIFYVLPDKLNDCSPSLFLRIESYSLQNFHSFDRSHYMFLLRDKKVQYCPTLLLVVISVMLLSCVVRKLDFFISQQKYIVRPIKRLEILPGMRISTRNLQNFYVKIFMAKKHC